MSRNGGRTIPTSIEITDPRVLRGLAHPVRLALIGLLRRDGSMTATEAGARIGESPALCSFHLRQLAKYGLVEEAGGGAGRQRPWRATARATAWSQVPDGPEQAAAVQLLSSVVAERYLEATLDWLERRVTEPVAWQQASLFGDAILHLTADELARLGAEVDLLVDRYADRGLDPALRPAGARAVSFIQVAFPDAVTQGQTVAGK